jgi:hypothetical protein
LVIVAWVVAPVLPAPVDSGEVGETELSTTEVNSLAVTLGAPPAAEFEWSTLAVSTAVDARESTTCDAGVALGLMSPCSFDLCNAWPMAKPIAAATDPAVSPNMTSAGIPRPSTQAKVMSIVYPCPANNIVSLDMSPPTSTECADEAAMGS